MLPLGKDFRIEGTDCDSGTDVVMDCGVRVASIYGGCEASTLGHGCGGIDRDTDVYGGGMGMLLYEDSILITEASYPKLG